MNKFTGIIVLALLVFLGSCRPAEKTQNKILVSVSILPQKYFVERIAGTEVEVNVMIPPGASPASYEPSLAQLSSLDRSKLYLKMGHLGFELSWMEKIASVNPQMKIVDLSKGIKLIHEDHEDHGDHAHHEDHGHSHSGPDPHTWLSLPNVKLMAASIYEELVLLLPDEKEGMEGRFIAFNQELDSLHRSFTLRLGGLENRNFLIYHPALGYFARDYQLNQFSLEIEGKTPSPAHMKKLTDLGRQKAIKAVFIQAQFDRRNAEILANEIEAKIIQFDPLDEDWEKQMRYIVDQFSQSL